MTDIGKTRRRVWYSGRVQGVGFRYTTVTLSRAFAVTGYVRNLSDGRVEVVADAYPNVLDRFLAAVSSRLEGFIERQEVETIARDEPFTTFSIHY